MNRYDVITFSFLSNYLVSLCLFIVAAVGNLEIIRIRGFNPLVNTVKDSFDWRFLQAFLSEKCPEPSNRPSLVESLAAVLSGKKLEVTEVSHF